MSERTFDTDKIKTFKLEELEGRTIRIERFVNNSEGIELLSAFDIHSGEVFILSVKNIPLSDPAIGRFG
ncbi:MAG: hypothetical protein Unbinned96contig1001_5 [Prokaryotic dsDNA virus sp.]|nr:MAG: hypothetical protein Unbinned96contig1001_5 [Prokaryotic dsDNA virus sp.]|tara:strand:- start:403 stop:609 length:207 start_codon:yes stop_codon:yes gene_type:complete